MQCLCGAVLSSHSGGGRQKRYCSDRCRQRAKRDNDKTLSAKRDTFDGMLNTITTGDCRELCKPIPDGSIDMIFTDPPYVKECMHLYGWLAEEAARVLKPHGFMLCYVGTYWKYDALQAIGNHLNFFWDFISLNKGPKPTMWKRRILAGYKSILAFTNGEIPSRNGMPALDVWTGGGKDKRFHAWGQDESTAMYYLQRFSRPGDTILEPFTGGGTTLYVAKQLKRNFIAFEIDPHTADIARKRLETVQPFLIDNEPSAIQMQMGA